MRTVMRRPPAMVSMALTVPLLLLGLADPPGIPSPGAAVVPRAAIIGLPGTQQGVVSDRIPFNLLLSLRRDDHGRTAPAGLGQLGASLGRGTARAAAQLAMGFCAGHAAGAVDAEPRAPPAR